MRIAHYTLTEEQADVVRTAAARIINIAKENPLPGYADPRAFEQAAVESMPTAVLYDLLVDEVAGPLSETEAAAARAVLFTSGLSWRHRVAPTGQALLRKETAAAARHVVNFLREQSSLALAETA